jgi:hypothetical protein
MLFLLARRLRDATCSSTRQPMELKPIFDRPRERAMRKLSMTD